MISLKTPTSPAWVDAALGDFDSLLLDHASCERKASAVGMSFVVRYPDRKELLDPMIHFAREELEHFHQVYRLIAQRGLTLEPDTQDEYVNLLMKAVRSGREERFLDRLLISGIIEARGCERLHIIADHLTDEKLKHFYARLARAEDSHRHLFDDLARIFFPANEVDRRLEELLVVEADAIGSVPLRAAIH